MPALIYVLLLPAFGQLYLRNRDTRNLLWLLAFCFVIARMILLYPTYGWGTWITAAPGTRRSGRLLRCLPQHSSLPRCRRFRSA